jgi:hypothetical protein
LNPDFYKPSRREAYHFYASRRFNILVSWTSTFSIKEKGIFLPHLPWEFIEIVVIEYSQQG